MEIKHPNRLWLIALFTAWVFDLLFWQKIPGINFFIYTLVCIATGLWVAYVEGHRPRWQTLLLILPTILFSAGTFFRQESLTIFLNTLYTLVLLCLLATTLLNGLWWRYSLADYLTNFISLGFSMLAKPINLLVQSRRQPIEEAVAESQPTRKAGWAVLRGILLALPVVLIMAALLASADPIFSKALEDVFKIFRIEKLGEYIFRGIYILIGMYLLVGVFLHALINSRSPKLLGIEKPLLPPFLGFTEAAIVLGAVELLFAAFVGFQFRYFFGGEANINLQGFTYAEYARRGFFELVAVAVLSLVLFLGLSAITRRAPKVERRTFSGLGVGLVVLVSVMLVSAFYRLVLYEAAYGFSRLRTYTHVFLVWIGILLAVTVILEILHRTRGFALALLLVSLGFGASLTILNVDGFIVHQNVQRAIQGQELDTQYLLTLSEDAVPSLVSEFTTRSDARVHDALGATLACWDVMKPFDRPQATTLPWQSFHIATLRAETALTQIRPQLQAYPVRDVAGIWQVQIGNVWRECYSYSWMD